MEKNYQDPVFEMVDIKNNVYFTASGGGPCGSDSICGVADSA